MNKEYIREKERVKRKQEGEKAAIPHRVFQSFLVSMENDINEYVIISWSFHRRVIMSITTNN